MVFGLRALDALPEVVHALAELELLHLQLVDAPGAICAIPQSLAAVDH